MDKFLILLLIPLFLFSKSGVLVDVLDGDSILLKKGSTYKVCHISYIDTLELKENTKLNEEMKQCNFSKEEFFSAAKLSHKHLKSLLKIGDTYNYEVLRTYPNRSEVCSLTLPKGLHIELYPKLNELMVSRGFAIPYIVHAPASYKDTLLKIAKTAKNKKLGLWKDHRDLLQCLVEHRYSLESLR